MQSALNVIAVCIILNGPLIMGVSRVRVLRKINKNSEDLFYFCVVRIQISLPIVRLIDLSQNCLGTKC